MKYIVLHREGTKWMNLVGNSLHVPFIEAESPTLAAHTARALAGDAPMYLVSSVEGWVTVTPMKVWKVDAFSEEEL